MDFVHAAAMVRMAEVCVDEDKLELIKRLCTEAGMIFEDVSAEAILIGGVSPGKMPGTIAKLRSGAQRASDLLAAAAAVSGTR